MASQELNKFSSFPPYPQMIMEALDNLKQSGGAKKSSISKYMESKYGEMPPGHSDMLSHHLTRMKDNGELLFIKNNYLKPGLVVPVKRGRGRPPKPKKPLPVGTHSANCASPRRRGRPRKEPNAPPAPKKPKPLTGPPTISKTGRPRGRPRKVNPQPLRNGVEELFENVKSQEQCHSGQEGAASTQHSQPYMTPASPEQPSSSCIWAELQDLRQKQDKLLHEIHELWARLLQMKQCQAEFLHDVRQIQGEQQKTLATMQQMVGILQQQLPMRAQTPYQPPPPSTLPVDNKAGDDFIQDDNPDKPAF